jgi:hypothetical protein
MVALNPLSYSINAELGAIGDGNHKGLAPHACPEILLHEGVERSQTHLRRPLIRRAVPSRLRTLSTKSLFALHSVPVEVRHAKIY